MSVVFLVCVLTTANIRSRECTLPHTYDVLAPGKIYVLMQCCRAGVRLCRGQRRLINNTRVDRPSLWEGPCLRVTQCTFTSREFPYMYVGMWAREGTPRQAPHRISDIERRESSHVKAVYVYHAT
ncbi:hypothetical protein CBL_09700 [Carabus blaptoides fortunei]